MAEPAQQVCVDPRATTCTATHLLYDGHGGWIEAKRVWLTFPHREVDDAGPDRWGWEFKTGSDLIRWLRVPGDDEPEPGEGTA